MKDLKSLIILFKAQTSVQNAVKQSLSGTGMSVNEFAALEALYHKKSLNTQELIDLVLIPNSSMTYVLDVLSKKGYIQRVKKKEDQRVRNITLTPEGVAVFESVYEKHFNLMRSIFDVLSKEEETQLKNLLKKIGKEAVKI